MSARGCGYWKGKMKVKFVAQDMAIISIDGLRTVSVSIGIGAQLRSSTNSSLH